ncbi:hypothetical protein [Helicobacter pylori]|uniref:hypothetical protein n=1 Tax=Helicobacter pylori TaxID=210 RepID=UPI00053446D0|nr:hypothetical protein [Helicobacter pylori]
MTKRFEPVQAEIPKTSLAFGVNALILLSAIKTLLVKLAPIWVLQHGAFVSGYAKIQLEISSS